MTGKGDNRFVTACRKDYFPTKLIYVNLGEP